MKKYKIIWRASIYGEQIVTANSEKEARNKAYKDDTGFERSEYSDFPEWVIDEIKEVK